MMEPRTERDPRETDRTIEYRIRRAAAALSEDPPEGFAEGVLARVRAEQRRRSWRRAALRWGGAAAAALLILPAAVVLVPRLLRTEDALSGGDASPETPAIPYAVTLASEEADGGTGNGAFLDESKTAVPAGGSYGASLAGSADPAQTEAPQEAPISAPMMMASPVPAPDAAEADEDEAAPEAVNEAAKETSEAAIPVPEAALRSMKTAARPETLEALLWRIVRAAAGDEAVDAQLAAGMETPRAVCEALGLTKEAILATAESIGAVLPDSAVAELFPEPENP